MADFSPDTIFLALAGSFMVTAFLTFLAAMICLVNTWGVRRRLRRLNGDIKLLRDQVETLREAERGQAQEVVTGRPETHYLEQHERRLQKRLKDLEDAIQQLRLEVVEQQTAKFQVNEAIRRAMTSTRGQG